jgi:hypothetical protein
MSVWGKFLVEIRVLSGWTWAWEEGALAYSVTIPAGRYRDVLDLLTTLRALIIADGATPTIVCSPTGTVSIGIERGAAVMTAVDWA